MGNPTLQTKYLGLRLSHPFMAGASPLADDVDGARRLEDGGSAAIVLRSLFEEQITLASSGRIHEMDPLDPQFADRLGSFPRETRYRFTPATYVEHVRRVKAAVSVPVIASLNGMTTDAWLGFASEIEAAGADALEVNVCRLVSDVTQSSLAVERELCQAVVELKRLLHIPIALKLLPYYTAFGHFARQLDQAGVDGLIVFNRLYEPDIDVWTLTSAPHLELADRAELLLRLRWAALLRSRVRCSLCITGGVATPTDGIKAVVAGADAVQLVTAVLQHGPEHLAQMRDGLARWLETNALTLDEARGRIAGRDSTELAERANYINTLHDWTA